MPTVKEMVEFINKAYKPDEIVAYDIWCVEDVMGFCDDIDRDDVSRDDAEDALEAMHEGKDCNFGFNWNALEGCLPPKREPRQGKCVEDAILARELPNAGVDYER